MVDVVRGMPGSRGRAVGKYVNLLFKKIVFLSHFLVSHNKELEDYWILRFHMIYLQDSCVCGIAGDVLAHPCPFMCAHMEERCLHGRGVWRSGVSFPV